MDNKRFTVLVSIRPILHLEEVRFLPWSTGAPTQWCLYCQADTDQDTNDLCELQSGPNESHSYDSAPPPVLSTSVEDTGACAHGEPEAGQADAHRFDSTLQHTPTSVAYDGDTPRLRPRRSMCTVIHRRHTTRNERWTSTMVTTQHSPLCRPHTFNGCKKPSPRKPQSWPNDTTRMRMDGRRQLCRNRWVTSGG